MAASGAEMPVIAHIGSSLMVGTWLFAGTAVYGLGVKRIWERGGVGSGVRLRDVVVFGSGILALAGALTGPVEALAEKLFSMHMTQHVILTLVAAPLLVMSRPLLPVSRVLAPEGRRWLGQIGRALGGKKQDKRPVLLWGGGYVAVFWTWHVPAIYEAALQVEALHALQHVSLLAVALGLWWSVAEAVRKAVVAPTIGVLAVIFLQGAWTGIFLALSDRLQYRSFLFTAPALGVDPVSDQRGGFGVMMVSGIVYVVAIVVTAGRALAKLERASPSSQPARAAADDRPLVGGVG